MGCSWGLCGRSWLALGAYVGGPGLLLGPRWEVLARSWGLCWRSWAALRALVDGPGSLSGLMGGLGPKSGPGSDGEAIWAGVWAVAGNDGNDGNDGKERIIRSVTPARTRTL